MKIWEFQGIDTVAECHDTRVFGFYIVSENALWGTEKIGLQKSWWSVGSIHFGWPLDIFCDTMQKGLLAGCFHMCGNHVPSVAERKIHEFLQVFPQNPLIPTQCLGQPRFSRLFMIMSCQLCHLRYRSRMGQSRSLLKYFQRPFQVEIGGTTTKRMHIF